MCPEHAFSLEPDLLGDALRSTVVGIGDQLEPLKLELQRIDLLTDPDNVASQRVAEKVGFQREGVLRAHLRHPDGRIRDSVMFSLLPGELRD